MTMNTRRASYIAFLTVISLALAGATIQLAARQQSSPQKDQQKSDGSSGQNQSMP
jgi:hypothetical protein